MVIVPVSVAVPVIARSVAPLNRTLPSGAEAARTRIRLRDVSFPSQLPTPRIVLVQPASASVRVNVHAFVRVALSVTRKAASRGFAACAAPPAKASRHAKSGTPSRSMRPLLRN